MEEGKAENKLKKAKYQLATLSLCLPYEDRSSADFDTSRKRLLSPTHLIRS